MQKPYNILLGIEDRDLIEYCKQQLSSYCIVHVAYDAQGVYQIMHEAKIDLAILDYSLPNVNPIELHEGMAFLHPETTIVLCVSPENRAVATRIWHKRAMDYIYKPTEGPRFVDDINKVLRYTVVQDYVRKLEVRIMQLEKQLKEFRGGE
jgi:PleD family two-component response regulator